MLMDTNSNISPKMYNPITLAFMGDCIFELLSRTYIVLKNGSMPAKSLHKMVVEIVSANAQAENFKKIESILTEEETEIFKRGKNATLSSHPKNTQISIYHIATGVEVLFGFLYLSNQEERYKQLFNLMME